MSSYYDSAAQSIIKQTKAPYSNIKLDVVEYPETPGLVYLRFYADNLYGDYSEPQIASIAEWINTLVRKLNQHPLLMAKYAVEVVE